jgi:hypothetical protein
MKKMSKNKYNGCLHKSKRSNSASEQLNIKGIDLQYSYGLGRII